MMSVDVTSVQDTPELTEEYRNILLRLCAKFPDGFSLPDVNIDEVACEVRAESRTRVLRALELFADGPYLGKELMHGPMGTGNQIRYVWVDPNFLVEAKALPPFEIPVAAPVIEITSVVQVEENVEVTVEQEAEEEKIARTIPMPKKRRRLFAVAKAHALVDQIAVIDEEIRLLKKQYAKLERQVLKSLKQRKTQQWGW